MAAHYSNHGAKLSLASWLAEQKIPYLVGADTRALTTRLRAHGVIPGAILKEESELTAFEDFSGTHWVREVSIKEPQYYGSGDKEIIVVDCGIKENILRCLMHYPVRIKRVPFDYDYSEENFDGVFLSNGPGDPKHCQATIHILQKVLKKQKPVFGICLGTQLLALAVGAETYKLPFGHRSHNQPCMTIHDKKMFI